MPNIRLMGFAAGTLFILSSAGNAQTLQAPGKALAMGQAPSTPISAAGNSPTPRQMLDHFYIQDNDAIIACNPGRNSVLDPSRLHGRPAAGGLV